ncbi:MAG: glutamate racemase [Clostridiales bacterium 43-6]|nr:MAG: glutamate racemase [Clostridiales bacterium 43-6]
MDKRPIGVFDSGLGGLTVVDELIRILPGEDIIYFGDTGRVPYGTRSRETIERYARQDEGFLLSKNVKLIIAACGTVSSVAPHTGDMLPVPFVEVVKPAAKEAAGVTKTGKIGVIGTTATILSGAYTRELLAINPSLEIFSKDCPLFVPLVEAGWVDRDDEVTRLTVRRYLAAIKQENVDTLILGCTHYPLIADIIGDELEGKVHLVSSGKAAAQAAAEVIVHKGITADRQQEGQYEFYVSDRPEGFSALANLFLKKDIDACVTRIDVSGL